MALQQRNTPRKSQTKDPIQSNEMGKMPPQALELEEAVLGAIMIERDAYSLVSEILKADCFHKTSHQKIYQAIVNLSLAQSPIDMHTVTEQLRKTQELDEAGGAYYIALLTAKVASAAHLVYHARIIVQKYLARELIRMSSEVQTKAFEDSEDIDDLMQEAEAKLFAITQQNLKKDVVQIQPVIAEAIARMQAAAKKEGTSGVPSGFHALDKMTSGWQKSDLIIIAARPAMGKTAFVLSMARNMAVDYKVPVAVFSLEMSNVQLVNRFIQNVCQIEGEKIKNGRLEPYEWDKLERDIKNLIDAPVFIDDTPSLSVFELRSKARRLVKEHKIACIMIDYLQLMNASGMTFGSREQEVSMISRSLKGLAKELDIPIIALSQLNRSVESRSKDGADGKRPQLSDLRESGAIEQDADMVCFIHRPEYYKFTEDNDGNSLVGIAEIIIAKHRNGAVGDARLKFKSSFAKFSNVDDYDSDTQPQYQSYSSKMNAPSNFYNESEPLSAPPPAPPITDYNYMGSTEENGGVPF